MSFATLKLTLRMLWRRKVFTAISLLGIAFTLTVLLVATALFDGVFGPHPPQSNQDRIVGVYGIKMTGPESSATSPAAYPMLRELLDGLPGAAEVSIVTLPQNRATYLENGQKVDLTMRRVDAAFFRIHDFRLHAGALPVAQDYELGLPVAVVNQSTAAKLFGEAPPVGQSFELDGTRFQVAAVVEDVPILRPVPYGDVWVPLTSSRDSAWEQDWRGDFWGIVLAESVDALGPMQSEFDRRVYALDIPLEDFDTVRAGLEPFFAAIARLMFSSDFEEPAVGTARGLLLALVLVFMALPAVNLANLSSSRILDRSTEIGIRRAFGATRGRLLRQFLAENVLLTGLGAALAVPLAQLGLEAIDAAGWLAHSDLGINWRVLAAGFAYCLAFGLLSGLVPAWKMSRLDPIDTLRGTR